LFFVFLPHSFLLGAYLAWKAMEETGGDKKEGGTIDFAGAFLLLASNTLLLYTIRDLPHEGISFNSVSLLLLSLAGFILLVVTELRAEVPILSLSLFHSRLFTFANLSLFFITSSQAAIQFLMPFYLQSIMGYSTSKMGWIIIANSVVIVMVAPIAGRLSDPSGRASSVRSARASSSWGNSSSPLSRAALPYRESCCRWRCPGLA
jgi:hypothetical protein